MRTLSFTEPYVPTNAEEVVAACLRSGALSGDGPYCHAAEATLRTMLNTEHALLTTSCTHALELACAMVEGQHGDEIIVPSFTFTSTATAIVRAGYVPVFADVEAATMNVDPEDVLRCITSRTRAIIIVHYAGIACDMDAIRRICVEHGLDLIEDAAHALGGSWNDQPLGTIGRMSTFSFHATKNITCGEGGAFVTTDDAIAERAEIFREKGTNRSQFIRGQVDKYTWVDEGSSYVLAEPLAALLSAGLAEFDAVQSRRRDLVTAYRSELADLHTAGILALPTIPAYAQPAWHLQHILLRSMQERDALIDHLKKHGIGSAFHYIPLHTSPMGRRLHPTVRTLPVTEDAAYRLLRLPLHTNMTTDDVATVASTIRAWSRA